MAERQADNLDTLAAERIPPQDLEAEQATLGAVLLGGEACASIAELLRPEDFYREAHGHIYRACLGLFERGEPIDTVSVGSELRAQDRLDNIGGLDYLDRLVRATPWSTNVERYARVVREKSVLRHLLFTSHKIAGWCYDSSCDAGQALDRAEAAILRLAETQVTRDFVHVLPVAQDVFAQAEEKARRGSDITGVSTGFTDLDRMLAGLQPGDLVILAARPSMGKTSLAINWAQHAAMPRSGEPVPVGIFSLEMSKEQLVAGMICTEAMVNLSRWRTGQLKMDDWTKIAEAMNRLSRAPLFIDDTPSLSPIEMRAKARRLRSRSGLGLIVVDYLQLMSGDGLAENRVNEISQITRSLKGLAKELDVPVVACAQLSRAVEQRQDKRPMLSDLRESGQIEADADVVMFIYRDSYYERQNNDGGDVPPGGELEDETYPDPAEVIIAKQRNGPTGTVELGFQRQFKRFVNLEDHDY